MNKGGNMVTIDDVKEFINGELEHIKKMRERGENEAGLSEDFFKGSESAYLAVLETIWWGEQGGNSDDK